MAEVVIAITVIVTVTITVAAATTATAAAATFKLAIPVGRVTLSTAFDHLREDDSRVGMLHFKGVQQTSGIVVFDVKERISRRDFNAADTDSFIIHRIIYQAKHPFGIESIPLSKIDFQSDS